MIQFMCPGCKTPYEVDNAFAGQEVECPNCKTSFIVPLPEGDSKNNAESPVSSKRSEEAAMPRHDNTAIIQEEANAFKSDTAMIKFMCPGCKTPYEVDNSFAGKKVKCNCGTSLDVPLFQQEYSAPPAEVLAISPISEEPDTSKHVDAAIAQDKVNALKSEKKNDTAVKNKILKYISGKRTKYVFCAILILLAVVVSVVMFKMTSRKSAIETVRAYLSAHSWRDRLPFVLNPEKVKPLMENYYKEMSLKNKFEIITDTNPVPDQYGFVIIQAKANDQEISYTLKKTQDGYRIDWEASVGYNPVSIAEFRATKPTTPVRVRDLAKLDDGYFSEFYTYRNAYYSIRFKEWGWGYVNKTSEIGKILFDKLKDGKAHFMFVEIQCNENARDGSFFLISKIINVDEWYDASEVIEQKAAKINNTNNAKQEVKNAEEQFRLGESYAKGDGVAKDDSEAVKWYRKAAEQNLDMAQFKLGICYYRGDGVAQNQTEAVKWFRKAAEKGYAEAQCDLGICYSQGDGVEQDQTEAFKWYHKAAEQGHADAQVLLAGCYFRGDGVEKNKEATLKWYRKAAEQGNAEAQYLLARCYASSGFGVEKNKVATLKWTRKAAEQGYKSAQSLLGDIYYEGFGVEKDQAEAVKWYQKAAAQGDKDAQAALEKLK